MAEVHYFDVEIAKRYGINCAVILQNIWHWVRKNEANDVNRHDGRYWTYNSTKAFQELFPYLSQKQIETALKKLRDEEIIVTGNYNVMKYDRTLWYAITDKGKCILLGGEMDIPSVSNGLPSEVKPIPYINPDVNADSKPKKERKTSYDVILADIQDDSLRELYLEYIKMRKLIKAPMTDRALTMLISKVNSLAPGDVRSQKKLLETAIINNWKSVYPIKETQQSQGSGNVFVDMLNELGDNF